MTQYMISVIHAEHGRVVASLTRRFGELAGNEAERQFLSLRRDRLR